MSDHDSISGLSHLTKTALPIIGRVGTIAGGIVSLLFVLEQVSGEIITAVTGFVLVTAAVTSGIVAFHRTTQLVDEKKTQVYSYPHNARLIATIVTAIASVLLVVFVIRVVPNLLSPRQPSGARPQGQQSQSLTRAAEKVEKAATVVTALTAIPTFVSRGTPPIQPAGNSPAGSTPPMQPRGMFGTPLPVDQMTDVTQLIQLGNDAIDAKTYPLAIGYFNRAIQVEATNAQAQFGLGQAYFYFNNLNAAVEPFQNALRLNISLHDAHAYLGWIYDYRNDKAKAIAEYDAFLKAAPRDDPFRQDVSDRQKLLTSSTPAPSLTPRSTIAPPTSTPTVSK